VPARTLEPLQPLRAAILGDAFWIAPFAGHLQPALIDVADRCSWGGEGGGRMLAQQDGDGVGFFARRAADHAYPNMAAGSLSVEELGNHFGIDLDALSGIRHLKRKEQAAGGTAAACPSGSTRREALERCRRRRSSKPLAYVLWTIA
jgi:hypothetical protein